MLDILVLILKVVLVLLILITATASVLGFLGVVRCYRLLQEIYVSQEQSGKALHMFYEEFEKLHEEFRRFLSLRRMSPPTGPIIVPRQDDLA